MKLSCMIDIDGTITNLDKYKLSNNTSLLDLNPKVLENKLLKSLIFKFTYLYSNNYKIRENVVETINYMNNNNIEINFVTKRFFASENTNEGFIIRKLIENMLINNKISYKKIIYTSGNKLKECLSLNVDFIIEDSPVNIKLLSQYFPVIVIDTPYNKGIKGNNIYRVKNWNEINNIINKLFIYKKSINIK